MLQPEHLRHFETANATPRRFVSLGAVALFHVVVVVAFATGLANNLYNKLPDELKVAVVKEQIPVKPPPPPPPPDLAKPPPPFVPPPEITIQNEAPATNAIHSSSTPPPPAAPKEGITAPASVGRIHECATNYYPAIAQRLNQEGTTVLAFHILPDGSITTPTVAESSGHDSLDTAAVRCATGWRYKPAMQNGQPIEVPWKTNVVWRVPH